MKKKFIILLAISIIIMLLLPYLAATFISSDAGMAVCFLLFFAVNPIYSVVIGAFAGKYIKQLWSMPIIAAILFLLGTWIFFDMGESAFILYSIIYLILGIISMLISMFICKKIKQ